MTRPVAVAVLLGCLSVAVPPLMAASSVNGDANGDGTVTVADVFFAINYLFGVGSPPAGPFDTNGDGSVGVADIFYLINYLFAGGPSPVTLQPPTITIAADASRQVNAVADPGGASVAVTGGDGTVFTLSIPPGALSEQVSLALTPVTATGLPLSGSSVAALHMQPEGLQFAIPATLTIAMPQAINAQQVFGFAYRSDGSFFHLVPLKADGPVVKLNVAHFSGTGIAGGATADCSALSGSGLQPRERARQRVECVLRRAGRTSGNLTGGDLAELEDAFGDWFRESIAPALTAARDCWALPSCANPRALLLPAVGEFVEWTATVDSVSYDVLRQMLDPLEAEGRALTADLIAAAILETEKSCTSAPDLTTKWNDVNYLLWVQRLIDTLGWPELDPMIMTTDYTFTACGLTSLKNGNFELGSLTGWESDGASQLENWRPDGTREAGAVRVSPADVRVLDKLGPLIAPEGSFMAMVATGLSLSGYGEGWHEQYSRIYQRFTVSPLATRLKFRYDVVTEEPDWVEKDDGCWAMDIVEVTLIVGTTRILIIRPNIDLVWTEATLVPGLRLVDLDYEAVFHWGWRDVDFDLTPYRGKDVVLEIRSTDVCDSVWDTAILIDDIRIE